MRIVRFLDPSGQEHLGREMREGIGTLRNPVEAAPPPERSTFLEPTP